MKNWTPELQYTAALIGSVFALGLIFFTAMTVLAWRSNEGLSERYTKVAVIIFAVVVAVAVSASGFGEQSTNSLLGLLGTIIGYLLGRAEREVPK